MTSGKLRALHELLLPPPYHDLCPRARSEHFIYDERWRSALPRTKLEIKFQKQLGEQQLQYHGCKKPARTSVPTRSKVQVCRVQAGELVFVALSGDLTQVVISQSVKNVRIRCQLRIEQDVSGRNSKMCAGGNFEPRGEG